LAGDADVEEGNNFMGKCEFLVKMRKGCCGRFFCTAVGEKRVTDVPFCRKEFDTCAVWLEYKEE